MQQRKSGPPKRPKTSKVTVRIEDVLLEEFDRYFASTYEPRNRLIEKSMRLMLDMAKVRDGQKGEALG